MNVRKEKKKVFNRAHRPTFNTPNQPANFIGQHSRPSTWFLVSASYLVSHLRAYSGKCTVHSSVVIRKELHSWSMLINWCTLLLTSLVYFSFCWLPLYISWNYSNDPSRHGKVGLSVFSAPSNFQDIASARKKNRWTYQ